jgi:hypothetical protein
MWGTETKLNRVSGAEVTAIVFVFWSLERDEADDRSSDEISIKVHGHLVHWPVPVKPTII